ncbi:predicted protein [Aspergillus terreus NIH2624]|uniref:F-box domain-containing protein n=1 Tax=Aspergillus terreus (strain NIH 2624 / FGSC A1156) TaxID=341663 RepID=Q0CRR8_ASPTN|nr:uncharacterized protein ATEG_03616 [Aspergillus terreus NIH2624]EAU35418.1 predicted protein [Aspergillus terreus NIH2624]
MHLLLLVFRRKVQGQERVQFGFTVRSRVHLDQSNPASIAGRLDRTCRRSVQGVQVDQIQWPRHENWDQTWDMRLASRIGSQRKPAMQPRWPCIREFRSHSPRTIDLCVDINLDACPDFSCRAYDFSAKNPNYRCTSPRLSCTTPQKTQSSEISQVSDFEALKACHRVCRKWCRVATGFLFCRVVRHRENSEHFSAILGRDNLSVLGKVLSIGRVDDTGGALLNLIRSDRSPQQLTVRPTIADVHQVRKRLFTTSRTGMGSRNSLSLPDLQEIRLTTNGPPYPPLLLFTELRNLHVDIETIQWPAKVTWKSLTDGHERSLLRNIHTGLDKTTDRESAGMIRQVLSVFLEYFCYMGWKDTPLA